MQIDLIIIVIGFVIAFLIEARHDYILAQKESLIRLLVSKEEQKRQLILKEQWHTKDWQYLLVIATVTALLYKGVSTDAIAVLTLISSLKILVFNVRLNSLFKVGLLYLSSDGFEGKFKGKEILYYSIAAVLFIASILYLWIM